MATRKNLIQLPRTREKIRTSMLINRLGGYIVCTGFCPPRELR
jgi:hypothetical protein